MYKVMIRDNISPLAADILRATNAIEVVIDNNAATSSPEALKEIIGDFHGIAVRSGTKLTDAVLESATNLKVIGRAGTGVDNIDIGAASKRGILVMNAPGGNTVTTAEHSISMMLALARNIPQATASIRSGRWDKKRYPGVEIKGKCLGIVGFGNVGKVVASLALGLGMEVIAFDPYVTEDTAKELKVRMVPLEMLYAQADFISLHVPKSEQTVNMINASSLGLMKKGVRLINCARGEAVNLDDLYDALQSGYVAGAALDVYPKEPISADLPILTHPAAIFTPHLGASTDEAQANVARMIGEQIAGFLTEGTITNAVNFPSMSKEMLESIKPYLHLAEQLGSIMAQLTPGQNDFTVSFGGEPAAMDFRPLTHALLKGYMGSISDVPVNYISAPALAKEKGIDFKESVCVPHDDFPDTIRLKLDNYNGDPNQIWGTVFANRYPRIVRLGEVATDAHPVGNMVIVRTLNHPGATSNVLNAFGKHNISIGNYQVGTVDRESLSIINVDTPVDRSIIAEIETLPNVISAVCVNL